MSSLCASGWNGRCRAPSKLQCLARRSPRKRQPKFLGVAPASKPRPSTHGPGLQRTHDGSVAGRGEGQDPTRTATAPLRLPALSEHLGDGRPRLAVAPMVDFHAPFVRFWKMQKNRRNGYHALALPFICHDAGRSNSSVSRNSQAFRMRLQRACARGLRRDDPWMARLKGRRVAADVKPRCCRSPAFHPPPGAEQQSPHEEPLKPGAWLVHDSEEVRDDCAMPG